MAGKRALLVQRFYPYGLNDTVRKVGNISKCKDELVVNTLFNKQQGSLGNVDVRNTEK